jgi:fructokinase
MAPFDDQGDIAAIEGGGTWFRCERVSRDGAVLAATKFATASPGETIRRVVAFFAAGGRVSRAGLGCFGPLDLDRDSPRHGHLLATPKPGWSGFDVKGALEQGLGTSVAVTTDVTAAALGEWRHGAARGFRSVLYVTVGTGVGGGALQDGAPIGGVAHPEMGHLLVRREPGDAFAGACPFHGDCLEGLIAGPALAKRTTRPLEQLADDHPELLRAARYLGQGLATLALALAPDVLVVGGGVTRDGALLPAVRDALGDALNGYFATYATAQDRTRRVVRPALGDRSALVGAVVAAGGVARDASFA